MLGLFYTVHFCFVCFVHSFPPFLHPFPLCPLRCFILCFCAHFCCWFHRQGALHIHNNIQFHSFFSKNHTTNTTSDKQNCNRPPLAMLVRKERSPSKDFLLFRVLYSVKYIKYYTSTNLQTQDPQRVSSILLRLLIGRARCS